MRIGIFTQWYEPEPGPAALSSVAARALVARGHEVHALTGFPNYPSGRLADGFHQRPRVRELRDGVNVLRVPLVTGHDQSSARRIVNYASFGLTAAVLGVPALPVLDAVWVNYSPITLALPMWVQQLLRGTPTVCDVADLWPDTMQVSGLDGASRLNGRAIRAVGAWCKAMYASSDLVTYISPGIGQVLATRGVPQARLRYLPKPADERIFHPGGVSLRATLGIDEHAVVLCYAGAMGAAQGLEALLEATALVNDPRLVVLLAGSGTQEEQLKWHAAQLGVPGVRFLGRLPQDAMTDFMATADVAYVSLADHPLSAVTMPSKTQATLASGRAILAAASGDLADLVRNGRLGFVARPGDAASIAAALKAAIAGGRGELARIGEVARARYVAEFSIEHTTDELEAILTEASTHPRDGVSRLRPAGVAR